MESHRLPLVSHVVFLQEPHESIWAKVDAESGSLPSHDVKEESSDAGGGRRETVRREAEGTPGQLAGN